MLNSCDEELQIWIGNGYDKMKEDGNVLIKMFSHKIFQCTKASMHLARTSLHAMTLKEHNDNVEKLVEAMESKIKFLSCGGKNQAQSSLMFFELLAKQATMN